VTFDAKETIMHAQSQPSTAPPLRALLEAGALAGEWVLDPRESSVLLKNKSMGGLARVNGVFRDLSGSGTVRPDGEVNGVLTVAAASIDTKNVRRDTHLRSADFFDSDNNPDITFTADSVQASGAGVAVNGRLAVRGRSRPLAFDAVASVQGDSVWLDAEVVVNRGDFGLTWNVMALISMTTTLIIHAVFTRG
jgi:polyisoprenoid-binding protein YceI